MIDLGVPAIVGTGTQAPIVSEPLDQEKRIDIRTRKRSSLLQYIHVFFFFSIRKQTHLSPFPHHIHPVLHPKTNSKGDKCVKVRQVLEREWE